MLKLTGHVANKIARNKIQTNVSIEMINQLMDCISKTWLILVKESFAQIKFQNISLSPVTVVKSLKKIRKRS